MTRRSTDSFHQSSKKRFPLCAVLRGLFGQLEGGRVAEIFLSVAKLHALRRKSAGTRLLLEDKLRKNTTRVGSKQKKKGRKGKFMNATRRHARMLACCPRITELLCICICLSPTGRFPCPHKSSELAQFRRRVARNSFCLSAFLRGRGGLMDATRGEE